jgi:hypothetical protein
VITTDMRLYDYYLYEGNDAYGFPQLSEEPKGKVKMTINITNQSIQDNINYSGASYIGLTHSLLDDSYVIQYGEEQLKVLYVNPKGRLKQVFLAKI